MAEMRRAIWARVVGRTKNQGRRQRTFRPVVEELAARVVPATLTWNGAGTDWGTAANWDVSGGGHAVPGVNDDVHLAGTANDPVIAAGTNATIGSLTTDASWGANDTLTAKAPLIIQGDGGSGHGAAASTWSAGALDLSGLAPPPPPGGDPLVVTTMPYLEVTGGHTITFQGGKINSDQTLCSVYVDGNSGALTSTMRFTSSFSDITANVFIGKTPGGVETQHGSLLFLSQLNAGVFLHGASTITVNDKGTLSFDNSANGSVAGIQFKVGEAGVTAHIDLLENGTITVTAPNAQPMPLPSITQENGTLEFNGKATINVGNGQPAGTPGLQLSGGILQLDAGSYVTSDLTATGSGVWWNPSPSSGTATTVLSGKVIWSSSGYISIGDMGGADFTNWVKLQCNEFKMNSGTLNIGVGKTDTGLATGDTILVQGAVKLNPDAGNSATLAVYAVVTPACSGKFNEQPFLTSANGQLTGTFASVGPYTGSPWFPPAGQNWQQDEDHFNAYIYYS